MTDFAFVVDTVRKAGKIGALFSKAEGSADVSLPAVRPQALQRPLVLVEKNCFRRVPIRMTYNCDKKGKETLPVDTVEIAIPSVWIVESWHVDFATLDDPVIGGDYPSDRCEEHSVATHKVEEGCCTTQDLPRHDDPATNDGSDNTATEDVDVARTEYRQVVSCRDAVCCDVRPDLSHVPARCREESCCTTTRAILLPVGDDVQRVPQVALFRPDDRSSGGRNDAEDTTYGENDWEERQLDVLSFGAPSVSAEIGNVTCQSGP